MCCKTSVYPLDPQMAATILTIGQFLPASLTTENTEVPRFWKREIPEENATVTVSLAGGCFEISIAPSISSYDHHLNKRITAGVYFEISAKYAEKVAGEIIQRATVVGCKDRDQGTGLVLARYPAMPMSFERVCSGFQAVLLNGHGLDAGYDHDHDHSHDHDHGLGRIA